MAQIPVLLALVGAMYFLILRPQQQKAKAQRELLNAISEGDAVVTTSGIYGVVTELDGAVAYLEVAEGIELKIVRSTIASIVKDPAAADDESK
jgi:preprotein translocase subunit YajC